MRLSAFRPVAILVMLSLTSLFTVLLALEAVDAARSQREAAERVLHDYAALGAEGVAQRLGSALYGRFAAVLAATTTPSQRDMRAPDIAALRNASPANARDVLGDSSIPMLVSRGDSLFQMLLHTTAALPSFAYLGVAWHATSHGPEFLIFQPVRGDAKQVAAIGIAEHDVAAVVGKLVAKDPVLPASLAHGSQIARGIGIRVRTGARELSSRNFDSASTLRESHAVELPQADLTVDVSLSETLAPALIIGGLPQSRVTLIITLLVLTVGLTVAAGDQLRRDLQLSRLREDFVASVSHELRTPLAHIRMFAETLRLGRIRSQEEADRSLAIVENEARRLEHLVENILVISRAERRALELHRELTNMTSLVQEVVGAFVPLATRSDARIRLELAPHVNAEIDAGGVRQILINLLDNAVKYGPRGQTIVVRLSSAAGIARLEVEDEGAGIESVGRARAWDRFWRAESVRRSAITGTGIGLAIVRELVELHGGESRIESAAAGGARVVISLPLRGNSR